MTLADQNFRFLRSIPEGVSSLVGRYLSAQRSNQRSGSSFAHNSMRGPLVGHQDFCCSLDRIHIDAIPSNQDAHFGAEPNSADHGA